MWILSKETKNRVILEGLMIRNNGGRKRRKDGSDVADAKNVPPIHSKTS